MLLQSLVSQLITARSAPAWTPPKVERPPTKRPQGMRAAIVKYLESCDTIQSTYEVALAVDGDLRTVGHALSELKYAEYVESAGKIMVDGVLAGAWMIAGNRMTAADRARLYVAQPGKILAYLSEHRQATTAQLARYMGCSKKSASSVLSKMRDDGAVEHGEETRDGFVTWRLAR